MTEQETMPVIRSGELFSFYSGEEQDSYFDAVASMPGDRVRPEAMFGTNGWRRRLAATGADPGDAAREFRLQWDSMDFGQRRDSLVAQAVSRYYGSMIGPDVAGEELERTSKEATLLSKDPVAALAAGGDPMLMSQLWQAKLFGEHPDYTGDAALARLNKEDGQWR